MSDLVGSIARARFERDFGSEHSWDSIDASEREFYLAVVRYDLIALEKAGHRIVPVEATAAMTAALDGAVANALMGATNDEKNAGLDRIWPAMLAAAPKVTP